MAYEVMLHFPMIKELGQDRQAAAVLAREFLGFARALLRFDAARCADQVNKLTADAYNVLDALSEADSGEEIVGYAIGGESALPDYAETVRLLMEAEAKHEYVGRHSVDAFALGLFEEIERRPGAEKASGSVEGDDEAKEEVPAHS